MEITYCSRLQGQKKAYYQHFLMWKEWGISTKNTVTRASASDTESECMVFVPIILFEYETIGFYIEDRSRMRSGEIKNFYDIIGIMIKGRVKNEDLKKEMEVRKLLYHIYESYLEGTALHNIHNG